MLTLFPATVLLFSQLWIFPLHHPFPNYIGQHGGLAALLSSQEDCTVEPSEWWMLTHTSPALRSYIVHFAR